MIERETSSFRDPSGYVFTREGILYRRVNPYYEEDYAHLMNSGLYSELVDKGLLISHEETEYGLKPELVDFISYPYEWSFSMLKDAALTTLKVQKIALGYGMGLKDASAYNIQFPRGKPVLIDTLSFSKYIEGAPWIAYRQFCQFFLNPLALMAYKDVRLGQLLRVYIDGIPSDLTAKLLPVRTYFRPALLGHIHAHSLGRGIKVKIPKMSKFRLLVLINHLESTIKGLKWKPKGGWSKYPEVSSYSEDSFNHKKELVASYLDEIKPKKIWDLGANLGEFSLLAPKGSQVISFDKDPACTELNYLSRNGTLPLLLDLTNPSPDIGWNNSERKSLIKRGPADTVLALALIHHLAITNNLSLDSIANFLVGICHQLIVEFIPKEDSQVQRLLATREDIFSDYTEESFKEEFSRYFKLLDSSSIRDTSRSLYLMERL